MGDTRWTQQGLRHCYNTKSHRMRGVRTPGGKLVGQCIDRNVPIVKHHYLVFNI
jgi:Ribosomal protein L34e